MKVLTAALLMSAFIAGPALACPGMSDSADYMKPLTTASLATPKDEEAMSTFDPATKPRFETEALEDKAAKKDEEVTE